jgi:glycosyltransferase involved in cell wall biosynthesis
MDSERFNVSRNGQPRVVHLHDSGEINGGSRVVHATARGLSAFGWTSSVICGDNGPLSTVLRRAGIQVTTLPLASNARYLRKVPAVLNILRQQRPDAAIVYGPVAGSIGGMAAKLAGIRNIVYHAAWPSYYADFDRVRRIRNAYVERVACDSASAIWCISSSDLELYRKRQPGQNEKLYQVPLCVAQDLVNQLALFNPNTGTMPSISGSGLVNLEALRADLHLSPSQPIITFVGRLQSWKGPEIVLRAYPRIAQSLPVAAVIVVGGGPERARLEEVTKELGIAEHVRFVGEQEDVAPYYALADVVTLPSQHEPFGMVAVEAMAAGRPVVATRVGGFADTVLDGQCGRLVPPDSPEELADAVLWVLQSREHARRLGAYARERALAEYSESRMAQRVDALLRQGLR